MNKIGPFSILKLSQLPTIGMAQWQRVVRPGVNGVALWNTGERAEPIELESHHPFTTLATAVFTYRGYCRLTLPTARPNLVEIEFAGAAQRGLDGRPQLYKVLHVGPVPGQVRALVRGHFAGEATNYQAWLCCRWVLQPITA